MQRLLSTRMFPPPRRGESLMTSQSAAALWLERASRPITDLADGLVASELLTAMGKTATGRAVTTLTWDKRSAVLHRALEFARSSGWIDINPLTGRRRATRPTGPQLVDPRVVVNPALGNSSPLSPTFEPTDGVTVSAGGGCMRSSPASTTAAFGRARLSSSEALIASWPPRVGASCC